MQIGEIVDKKYQILKKIGSGGFATVYKAWDLDLRRYVAIKAILPDYIDDEKLMDRFYNELLITAQLEHENIVQVYQQIRTKDKGFHIVMQYINGVDFKKVINHSKENKSPLPVDLSVYIVCEIAGALDYAHTKTDTNTNTPLGIVHRDVSPSNILISYDGRVKLTDFGIARAEFRPGGNTQRGDLIGKCHYIPPEQIEKGISDHRSDIYSLGVVLFEAISGVRPFEDKSLKNVLKKIVRGKIDSKPLEYSNVSDELKEIILRMIARNPNDRYQSAFDVRHALYRYISFEESYITIGKKLSEFIKDTFADEYNRQDEAEIEVKEKKDEDTGIVSVTPILSSYKKDEIKQDKIVSGNEITDKKLADEKTEKIISKKIDKSISSTSKFFDYRFLLVIFTLIVLLTLAIIIIPKSNRVSTVPTENYGNVIIESYPPGADITIGSFKGKSPLRINKLPEGEYSIKMQLKGYNDFVQSASVSLKKDESFGDNLVCNINGKEGIGENKNRFIFYFSVPVHITSNPPGSLVLVNGVSINKFTPCVFTLQDSSINVNLQIKNFESINDYRIDLASSIPETIITDKGGWQFWIQEESGTKEFYLSAILGRKVKIFYRPTHAKIKIDGKDISLSDNREIFLLSGKHTVYAECPDWLPYNSEIEITPFSDRIDIFLRRMIKFSAMNEQGTMDLFASLTLKSPLSNGITYKTPVALELPFGEYTALFTLTGYNPVEVSFSSADKQEISVKLTKQKSRLKISAVDEKNNEPISNAEVHIKSNNQFTSIGKTDEMGNFIKDFDNEGKYEFKITCKSYRDTEPFILELKAGELKEHKVLLKKKALGGVF